MITEALRTASGIPQNSDSTSVPQELWKSSLLARRNAGEEIPESLWFDRALRVEEYIQSVLTGETDIVAAVELDDNHRDSQGPDARIRFVKGFPIDEVLGEFKSSPETIEQYKQKMRNGLPEGERDSEHLTKLMVERRIILINGGVGRSGAEKTPDKIRYKSFYPQVLRIIESRRIGDSDEAIYGVFYSRVAEIKQKIKDMEHAKPLTLFDSSVIS